MNNITFIIFTYNEEKRLPFVLRNFSGLGRICIMDGGSTDRTKEIAESFGASFFSRPPSAGANVETPENFNFIKTFLNTDWIYWGYADNIAPKALLDKLAEISNQDRIKQVLIPIYTYLWGNTKNYALKGYAPFFFHKDFVDFSGNHIHGIGKFTGNKDQILTLPNKEQYALKHFSAYNEVKFVSGHMRYAEVEAQEKFAAAQKFSLWRLFRAMFAYAWMFTKQGYKNGKLGVLIMLNYISYRVMAYTRLYELENNITLENIEDNYSKAKEKMLKELK
jgi:glycosyltransferase involved in cell wall biosynthesis